MGDISSIAKRNKEIIMQQGNEIIEYYKNNPNVSDTINKFNVSRSAIVDLLNEAGVYKGFCHQPSRSEKRMKTMQQRHGVINFGQTDKMRLRSIERNSIPYTQPTFLKELNDYRIAVNRLTTRNKKKLLDTGYCFYTGISFGDVYGDVNPNDPIKKTIDHKISIVDGYLKNYPVEVIGGISNLCWAIRYCNTFKGNMSADSFLPYAITIRERFIDAGYKHN